MVPLVQYGTIWYHKLQCGPVWYDTVLYGPIWFCMVPYGPVWPYMVLYCLVWSCMVLYGPVWFSMVPSDLYGPVWSSMVLHEKSDNYVSQHEITHNSIRNLEKNKKALNSTLYHNIAKDYTRYLVVDSMLYHKIAIDSSFSNKLYPNTCAPIVRLVIFH